MRVWERNSVRESAHDISYFLWPSFRVLSFTRRRPLPPRPWVMAPASLRNNEGLPQRNGVRYPLSSQGFRCCYLGGGSTLPRASSVASRQSAGNGIRS